MNATYISNTTAHARQEKASVLRERKPGILEKVKSFSRIGQGKNSRPQKRNLSLRFLSIAIIAGIFGSSSIALMIDAQKREAHAFNVTEYVICKVLSQVDGIKLIYDATQTSNLQFEFLSKSAIGASRDDVDNGLNSLVGFFNGGFDKINEPIIGYKIRPDAEDTGFVVGDETEKTPEALEERYNKGVKVNPYDRFGIAGMKFTSYAGEWKHLVVDACNPTNATDPKAGMFYEDRLEPQSTWEDRDNSYDPRTIQYAKGFFSQFSVSFANVVANGIFSLTKSVVVLTTGAINFAFSDILEIFGIDELIGGDKGVFSVLYKGVFLPLVFLMFVFTAGSMFYKGIVKRAYRDAYGSLVRGLGLFLLAIIIAANPSFWIAIPNNIAVTTQAVILSSMNTGLSGGGGLCATDIGSKSTELVDGKVKQTDQDLLTQASENMRSSIGCQFWQMLLFKPWAQGQFGTDWNSLWAVDSVPKWAKDGKAVKNQNSDMVGKAEVPMGDGSVLNNWALYHISTQTNVHSPTDFKGDRPKYSNSTANDWWRIADAFSNYQEEEVEFTVGQMVSNNEIAGANDTVKYTNPKADAKVLTQWDDWTGNNSWNRIPTAFSSLIIAIIALIAPLVFALLAAIYTVGMAILMSIAPVMLLLGIWDGRGWEIFKGWANTLLNTFMKRIAIAVLMVLAITFVATALKVMDDIGWFQGILLLIMSSVMLLKARGKIMDAFASFSFSNYDMSGNAKRVQGMITKPAKDAAKLGMAAGAGGVAAKRHGAGFFDGAGAAGKNQLRNFANEKPGMRSMLMGYEAAKSNQTDGQAGFLENQFLGGQINCIACGKTISVDNNDMSQNRNTAMVHAARLPDGNYLCHECFTDGDHPDAVEFIREFKPGNEAEKRIRGEAVKSDEYRFAKRFTARTQFNGENSRITPIDENSASATGGLDKVKEELAKQVMANISIDIKNYQLEGDSAIVPEVPKEIREFVNADALYKAWEGGHYEYIKATYAHAFAIYGNRRLDEVRNDNPNLGNTDDTQTFDGSYILSQDNESKNQ